MTLIVLMISDIDQEVRVYKLTLSAPHLARTTHVQ